jgi:TolA-binding protein
VRLKREPQALDTFGALLKRFPQTRFEADARYWRSVMMENAGETAAAEAELRRALSLDATPETARKIRYRLAGVLHKLDKLPEAADLLQALLNTPSKDDMSPALLEWLSTLRLDQGAFTAAAEAAQTLVAHAKDEPWHQIGGWLLGRARTGLKDRPGAVEAFEQGAAGQGVTRARLEALLELGRIYLEDGKADDAEARYSAAAELAADAKFADQKARGLYGLGCVAATRQQWEIASRYFLSVAILFDHPGVSAESLYRAAQAFDQMKQPDKRAQMLDELKQRYPDSEWARKAAAPAP